MARDESADGHLHRPGPRRSLIMAPLRIEQARFHCLAGPVRGAGPRSLLLAVGRSMGAGQKASTPRRVKRRASCAEGNEEALVAGRFHVKRTPMGGFQFVLVCATGQAIATGVAYKTKTATLNAIKSARVNSLDAELESGTDDRSRLCDTSSHKIRQPSDDPSLVKPAL